MFKLRVTLLQGGGNQTCSCCLFHLFFFRNKDGAWTIIVFCLLVLTAARLIDVAYWPLLQNFLIISLSQNATHTYVFFLHLFQSIHVFVSILISTSIHLILPALSTRLKLAAINSCRKARRCWQPVRKFEFIKVLSVLD